MVRACTREDRPYQAYLPSSVISQYHKTAPWWMHLASSQTSRCGSASQQVTVPQYVVARTSPWPETGRAFHAQRQC
jgi:exoribonuclease II